VKNPEWASTIEIYVKTLYVSIEILIEKSKRVRKSRKQSTSGQPLCLGSAGGAMGWLQAFSWRVDTLSVLSPICRVKFVQGPAQDGTGVVVEWLEGQDMSVTPDEHRQCVDQPHNNLKVTCETYGPWKLMDIKLPMNLSLIRPCT
jgi:hypothetical protein